MDFNAIIMPARRLAGKVGVYGSLTLNQLIEWRGKPCVIRCDRGQEYISETTKTWAAKHGIELAFIQPGQPQQNA